MLFGVISLPVLIVKAALEGGEQPHAHIMYSERKMDGIERDPAELFKRYNAKNPQKGGAQKASGGKARGERKDELLLTRQRWADIQNSHLERHGHAARVDHRSLKEQGIERDPEKHLGGAGVRSMTDADISALLEHRAAEDEHEMAQLNVANIIDLSDDLSAARAERTRQDRQEEQEVRPLAIQDKDGLWREQAPGIVIPPGARVAQQGLDGKWRVVKSPPVAPKLPPVLAPGPGINPLSRYHPDNIARRALEAQEMALAIKIETERANKEMVDAMERHAKRPHRSVEAILDAAPTTPWVKPVGPPERPVEAILDATPTPTWEKPQRSLVDLLKASLDAFRTWIKAQGMKHEDANVQQGEYIGAIIKADELHAVQNKGRGSCVIHEQANLTHALKVDESNKEIHIKYRNGHGVVLGVIEADTPDTPARPRGPGR